MRTRNGALSTEVDLKCRVYWGPSADLEFSASAVSLEPGSMALRLPEDGSAGPDIGERVELQVFLPVNVTTAGPKCLSCRAEVVRISHTEDGQRQLDLSYRKAAFRDLIPSIRNGARKSPKLLKKAVAQ